MEKITFEVIHTESINDKLAKEYITLLSEQGKVKAPKEERILRCKMICLAYIDSEIVAVGAIKKKTISDFNSEKANVPKLEKLFEWELGYCFTKPEFEGLGISSFIVKNLLNKCGNINLMASTELFSKNTMIRILEKNGFKSVGTPWESGIHDGLLGLFIRSKRGETKEASA